jgi:glycosyltransferase involved in cell wall biosynthesis
MKLFVLPPCENWCVDDMVTQWVQHNPSLYASSPEVASHIWLLADWCWDKLSYDTLRQRKVLTTVHHLVPNKMGSNELRSWNYRDTVTTAYHVFNQHTLEQVRALTSKPIHQIPYWVESSRYKQSPLSQETLRTKHGLPVDGFLIGSAQRDTEGHDLKSPKLEKGPDILCDFLEKISDTPKLHVVLAGWRRQYVINRLQQANVQFTYFERPDWLILQELYQTLDVYVVSGRFEGGPMALQECGMLNVPVIATPVGIAEQVLPTTAINIDLTQATSTVPTIPYSWHAPDGMQPYRDLLASL